MTAERRLSAARQALFAKSPPSGRLQINDDFELFHIVAEMRKPENDAFLRAYARHPSESERAKWEAEADRKPASIREAARKQAETARRYPNRVADAVAERLRRKAVNSPLTTQDMADIEGLIQGDSWKAQLIEKLVEGLRQLGIRVAAPLVK